MLTFTALAVLFGGTFSFCDRRRTDDLPVSSGGENRKLQFSVLLSPVTFSSLKICRLILEKQIVWCQEEGSDPVIWTLIGDSDRAGPTVLQGDVPLRHRWVRPQAMCPRPGSPHPAPGELPPPRSKSRRSLQLTGQEGRFR